MTATVIDGKAVAAKLREKIAADTAALKAAHGLTPGLATVLVGSDPASEVYVKQQAQDRRGASASSRCMSNCRPTWRRTC